MVIHGDCLDIMPTLEDKSIDMILCDLPYGSTACHWDTIIPFEPLWKQYKRLIKDNGAIVLTASQPFTSALVMSNPAMFKYEWIWEKDQGAGFVNAKNAPLKKHENILVFSIGSIANGGKCKLLYFPQGLLPHGRNRHVDKKDGTFLGARPKQDGKQYIQEWKNYPVSILYSQRDRGLHPTQKPVALFEYLIRTYTNEGDTVLDNCAGSFTTAIACMNTNRKYICIEKEEKYFEIGKNRINNHQPLFQRAQL